VQRVLGWTPLEAGAGFPPHTIAIVAGTQVTGRRLSARDPRAVVSASLLLSATGFGLPCLTDAGSGYLARVAIPGVLVMFGAGLGSRR
jgi:hypothetical protein